MKALGWHFLIELKECDANRLRDPAFIENTLRSAVTLSGAHSVGELFHPFSPHGFSAVILIAESHFSIHTWPEYRYAAVDFFTCNSQLRIQETYQFLVSAFHSQVSSILEMKRGLDVTSV